MQHGQVVVRAAPCVELLFMTAAAIFAANKLRSRQGDRLTPDWLVLAASNQYGGRQQQGNGKLMNGLRFFTSGIHWDRLFEDAQTLSRNTLFKHRGSFDAGRCSDDLFFAVRPLLLNAGIALPCVSGNVRLVSRR
jgi:hypothetical protein